MVEQALSSIFDCLDYRDFLKNFYLTQKSRNPWYSYRVFAQRAKLASPNYLKLVIDGKRRITDKNIDCFIKGLNLNPLEARYFRVLVLYKDNEQSDIKAKHLQKMLSIKRSAAKAPVLSCDKHEVLKCWYHWAIREMVLLKDFVADPQFIAQRLGKRISPLEALESLNILERLKFLEKISDNKFKLTQPLISTTDEISSKLIRELHIQFIQLAMDSILKLPMEQRVVQGVTIALPKAQIEKVKEKIKSLCKEVSEMFAQDYQNDEVFHLVINLFPLTSVEKKL